MDACDSVYLRQDEFCLWEMTRHLFLHHIDDALDFAMGGNPDTVYEQLTSIASRDAPSFWSKFSSQYEGKYHYLQWMANAIAGRVKRGDSNRSHENQDFYMHLMMSDSELMKSDPQCNFVSILLGAALPELPGSQARVFLERFFSKDAYGTYHTIPRAMFTALAPKISETFRKMKWQELTKQETREVRDWLGIIFWYRDMTVDFVREIFGEGYVNTSKQSDRAKLFSALCLLNDPEAVREIDTLQATKDWAPFDERMGKERLNRFALANRSLAVGKDFMSTVMGLYRRNLYENSYFSGKFKDVIDDESIQVLALLIERSTDGDENESAFQEAILNLNLNSGVKTGMTNIGIVKELQERIANDRKLLAWIATQTGSKHNSQDLVRSLPKLFYNQLVTMGVKILEHEVVKTPRCYFCDDDEMRNDKLFICYFCILHSIMEVMMNQKDLMDAVEQVQEFMREHVLPMLNESVKEMTLGWMKDVFSLIFLKDSNGKFVCRSEVARKLMIESTLGLVANDYFDEDLLRAFTLARTYLKLLGIDGREICGKAKLEPLKTVIHELTVSGKVDSVNFEDPELKNFPKFNKVIKLYALLRDMKRKTPNEEDPRSYWIEQFFGEGKESEYIDFEVPTTPKRRRYQSHLEAIDVPHAPVSNSLLLAETRTHSLDMFDLSEGQVERQWLVELVKRHRSLGNDRLWFYQRTEHEQCRLWNGFDEYQRMSQRLKENAHLQAHGELVNPIDIIDKIRECGEGMDMKQIETLLGPRAVELIITYSKIFNNRLLDLISEKSEITGLAVMYQMASSKQKFAESDKKTIYKKFLKAKFGKFEGQDEYECVVADVLSDLDKADKQLVSLGEKEFSAIVEKALNQEPIGISLLNDMYAREPDMFMKSFTSKLSDIHIDNLLELDALMSKRSLPKLKKMGFEKVNVDDVVNQLVEKEQWHLLLEFIDDFVTDTAPIKKRIVEKRNEVEKECPALLKKLKIQAVPMQAVVESSVTLAHFSEMFSHCKSLSSVLDALNKINFVLTVEMNNHLIDVISRVFSAIKISTSGDEDYALFNLPKISKILSRINTSSFNLKVDTLVSLLRLSLVSRFGIVIELKGFTTEAFGRAMARLALKYDYVQMMLDVCSAWSIDFVGFTLERSLFPFRMGLPDVGLSMLKGIPLGKREYMVPTFVNLLSHESLFNLAPAVAAETEMDTISTLVSMEPLHQRWADVLEKGFGVLMGSPAIKALHEILLLLNEKGCLISFYCLHMDFDDAIEVWNTVANPSTKTDLFIKAIVYTALAFWNWNTLWRKLLRDDSNLTQFKDVINGLFKFLKKNGMGRILYDVQMKLGMYEDAYASAVFSLESVDTWPKRRRICEQMKDACAKAGAKAIQTQLVELQISIIDICMEHDVEPARFRSILGSKNNAISVGILLMKLGEAEKFMAMIHFNLFSMEEGCHKLLDTVMEEGSGALQRLFVSMQKCSAQTYEVLVMCLFSAMRERVADVESLKGFIENCVRNDMKGRVYLTCEFLNEAFVTAQKTKDKDLMWLINDAAQDKGNDELVAKTAKYL